MMNNCFISVYLSQFGEFKVWWAPMASKSKASEHCATSLIHLDSFLCLLADVIWCGRYLGYTILHCAVVFLMVWYGRNAVIHTLKCYLVGELKHRNTQCYLLTRLSPMRIPLTRILQWNNIIKNSLLKNICFISFSFLQMAWSQLNH